MTKTKPLAGLLVVALEQAVAAPICSARLARAGARVIKIERPEGDFARGYDRYASGEASYFAWLNQGKESIALDLKQADDLVLLRRILAKADVFIQNLLPGATQRLGLDSESLRAQHPRLITVDISGYGEGAFASRKAYDFLVQAESGLADITGSPDGPARVGIAICDISTGLQAYQSVLEALLARGLSGQGTSIKVAMFDVMAELMTAPFLQQQGGLKGSHRVGLRHPSIVPYGAYPTKDGAVMIAIQNEREWQKLARDALGAGEWIDDPRFIGNPARLINREVLEKEISARTSRMTRAEAMEKLDKAGVAYAQVSTLDDLARHPQIKMMEVPLPKASVAMPAAAVLQDGERAPPAPVPALNQHGPNIRREFG